MLVVVVAAVVVVAVVDVPAWSRTREAQDARHVVQRPIPNSQKTI
jgi:hypothetical protein